MSQFNSPERALALEFPLHGSRLIEASAGTGKLIPLRPCMCV